MNTPRPTAEQDTEINHQDEVLVRVGQTTRTLHDSVRGLGFDKLIEKAAHEISNARNRLDYVAKMTEQAAQRVLNATDAAGPLQDKIGAGASELENAWQKAVDSPFSERQYRAIAERTRQFCRVSVFNNPPAFIKYDFVCFLN